jgi:hypothetical protein
MLLTYSRDRFVTAIQAGTKIHTIRVDWPGRWRVGMKIHHWRGNPRNVRSNPYQFAVGECLGIQHIVIRAGCNLMKHRLTVTVDGRFLTDDEIETLARNDGLTVEEMYDWFLPKEGYRCFSGRIIHFTDKMY